jgi:hypothetical protein
MIAPPCKCGVVRGSLSLPLPLFYLPDNFPAKFLIRFIFNYKRLLFTKSLPHLYPESPQPNEGKWYLTRSFILNDGKYSSRMETWIVQMIWTVAIIIRGRVIKLLKIFGRLILLLFYLPNNCLDDFLIVFGFIDIYHLAKQCFPLIYINY